MPACLENLYYSSLSIKYFISFDTTLKLYLQSEEYSDVIEFCICSIHCILGLARKSDLFITSDHFAGT